LLDLLNTGKTVNTIVLSGDIRSSTFLMKEVWDFRRFASTIGQFIETVSTTLRSGEMV